MKPPWKQLGQPNTMPKSQSSRKLQRPVESTSVRSFVARRSSIPSPLPPYLTLSVHARPRSEGPLSVGMGLRDDPKRSLSKMVKFPE